MVIRPANIDLDIYQGATFDKTYQWQDSNRDPVDLTGYTARMQIRSKHSAADYLLEITTEGTTSKRVILGGTEGTYQITIASNITEAFDWGAGVYDLELVSPGGVVRRIQQGQVKVHREVTRV